MRLVCLVLPLAMALLGCQAAAINEVRMTSLKYQSVIRRAPSTIRIDQIDRFLTRVSRDLLKQAPVVSEELRLEYKSMRSLVREASSPRPIKLISEAALSKEKFKPFDRFKAYLVHSEAPNAATPGDNMAQITSRLFLEVKEPEFVVAALAHELGHIVAQHMIHQVVRRKGHSAFIGTIAVLGAAADGYNAGMARQYGYSYTPTDWGGLARDAITAYKPWRKRDEFDADLIGLKLYVAAGYDPKMYIGVFKTLFAKGGDKESDTHPPISERIARIETALEAMGDRAAPSKDLDRAEFRSLQTLLADYLVGEGPHIETNEESLASLIGAGTLSTQLNCCGSIGLNPKQTARQYQRILNRRASTP